MNNTADRMKIIVEAALKIFARKGYHKTTVDEIAEQSGVVRGTVLHYFGCKERLFNAALDTLGESIAAEADEVMNNSDISVTEAISELIGICSKQVNMLQPDESVNDDDETDFSDRRYNIDAMRLKINYRIADSFAELIKKGNSEGTFNISNPKARAESLIFAVFGITGSSLDENEISAEIHTVVKNMLGIDLTEK